jgi:hypothetical protein
MDKFIELILKNLSGNGFPEKRVSFPLEKMYEMADNRDLNFNDVLKELETNHKTSHEKGLDKIVFFKEAQTPEAFDPNSFNMDDLKGMDQAEMMKKAQEMMGQFSPEQMQQAKSMMDNMSPEEKEKMMKKAKGMGF